jgi:hypothetical protein
MGILDDAIRDHLDLKRRRGTDEPEIKRLEDEAFGPPGRPDASGVAGPTASAVAEPPVETSSPEITPEDLGLESLPETPPPAVEPGGETPPPDGPAPEQPPEPQPERTPDGGADASSEPVAEQEGGIAFHDFAAEEGLVGEASQAAPHEPTDPVPTDPVERALAQPTPEAEEEPDEAPPAEAAAEPEATDVNPATEPPPPHSEDTQVHDMAKEMETEPEDSSAPPADTGEAETSGEGEPALELDVEELDIELTDDEAGLGEKDDGGEEEEDVLEETPEFLRDAPESDRLWFEQGKPKDFDFDEE